MHGEYRPPARIELEVVDSIRDAARDGRLGELDPMLVVELCDQLVAERVRADMYHRAVEAAEAQLNRR